MENGLTTPAQRVYEKPEINTVEEAFKILNDRTYGLQDKEKKDVARLTERLNVQCNKLFETRTIAKTAVGREKELRLFLRIQIVLTLVIMMCCAIFALAVAWGNGTYTWIGIIGFAALGAAEILLYAKAGRKDH